jgi:hypothetical protein
LPLSLVPYTGKSYEVPLVRNIGRKEGKNRQQVQVDFQATDWADKGAATISVCEKKVPTDACLMRADGFKKQKPEIRPAHWLEIGLFRDPGALGAVFDSNLCSPCRKKPQRYRRAPLNSILKQGPPLSRTEPASGLNQANGSSCIVDRSGSCHCGR